MILNFSTWWEAMQLMEKIYWCIAIPFSTLFLILLVLTFFGGDLDDIEAGGDADASVESDTGIDFQFITFKNLTAFFTVFGWVGIASLDGGMSLGVALLISSVSGLVIMAIMASLMYFMGKLTSDGSLKMDNAIGKTGSVYLTIPPKREGLGKVQVKVQGFRTLDAMTDSEEGLPSGSIIIVEDILSDEILLVRSSKK